jgi:hypothetical protein
MLTDDTRILRFETAKAATLLDLRLKIPVVRLERGKIAADGASLCVVALQCQPKWQVIESVENLVGRYHLVLHGVDLLDEARDVSRNADHLSIHIGPSVDITWPPVNTDSAQRRKRAATAGASASTTGLLRRNFSRFGRSIRAIAPSLRCVGHRRTITAPTGIASPRVRPHGRNGIDDPTN